MYMQRLTPYHANMIANNVDYNWNGVIERKELKFDWGVKKLVDHNRDGRVSTGELAYSLQRGDIYISHDRRAHRNFHQSPWSQGPGYPYNRNPYQQPYPNSPYSNSGQVLGTTIVGAGIGAGVGYAVGGSQGAGTGAAIGGVLGFISNLFE